MVIPYTLQLDELFNYGFKVHGILIDGSNNNHQFTRLVVKPENACLLKYCATDPYDCQNRIGIIQDCKHVTKKIRNSVLSSRHDGKEPMQVLLKGKHIFWEHFQAAYEFNNGSDFRLYRKLNKEHVNVNSAGKMRNHLAINVLDKDMLNLMHIYQGSLLHPEELNSTIKLLEQTTIFVEIFSNNCSKVHIVYDQHIQKLLGVLDFFHSWESEFVTPQDKAKH